MLRVYAPTGVLLRKVLGLKIDDKHVGRRAVLRCMPFACSPRSSSTKSSSKTAEEAARTRVFVIFQTEEAGIGIPISLKGFGEGVAALR